ncbi:MAG TPA: energy-coupling factor ABC transporter permease [Tepidisphaeraceae bacterium]|jgi:cobalt/nickel transport system permease protein|nr:energy-coupling factor ABC transporter permease [Tepidisphaeraceae bacterium]
MHIPDGFLNGRIAAVAGVLSAGAIAMSVRQTRKYLPARKVPLMGLTAAFVFAAQMLNFPVAGGTSGHMVGGVLCSVLLGPSAAILVISSVLIVQCFVFADGGVLALGANIFNMAVVCSVGGYYVYSAVYRLMPTKRGRLVAVAFSSWVATVLAAIVCAGELALSGTIGWSIAFPAMAGVHMLIGVGEAIITTLVIFAMMQSRPDLLEGAALENKKGYWEIMVFGAVIAIGLALFVSPFACAWPDGLDHVADALGFMGREAKGRIIPSPMPDYVFPGVKFVGLATSIAGVVGTVVAFGLAVVLARVLVPGEKREAEGQG